MPNFDTVRKYMQKNEPTEGTSLRTIQYSMIQNTVKYITVKYSTIKEVK